MYTLNHSYLKSISYTCSITKYATGQKKNIFQIPWTSLKVQPPSNMAICKSREEVASLSEKYSTGRCIAAKLSIATPMPSIPWVLRMVTCPDRDQGVKSDFKNKMRKPMKTMGFKTSKELVVAKSDYTVASQIGRNNSIDLLLCDSYSLGGWLGQWPGQTVKYKNVSQLRCCRHRAAFVDSSSLDDVRLRGITYPENWERYRNLKWW